MPARPLPPAAPIPGAWPAARPLGGADLLAGVGLLLAVVVAYLPAVHGGFIWNDAEYVTAPHLRSWDGLLRIWTEVGATEQYYPLLHSAFWVQHQLWGDVPTGYHLVGLLLHALSAGLFALILLRLAVPGAWLAGFLFALHPVATESVAWIAEQKNTLSAALGLGAVLAYLRFAGTRRGRDYAVASGLFLCALLAKTTTAVLPPAILVVLWWRQGRLEARRDVGPLVPWIGVAAAMGLFSAWVERHFIGADGPDFALGALERLLLAGRVVWFYLGKIVWPAELIFIYPRWEIDAGRIVQWLPLAGVLVTLTALWAWRGRQRAVWAAALLYGGMLFPVMGFFNLYAFIYSYVADHWVYLPMLAPLALAAAALTRGTAGWPRFVRGAGAVALLGGLGILTFRQSGMYADMETFYRTTLAANPACWMAHHNLGSHLRERGRRAEARHHYEQALALRPVSPKTLHSLAVIAREEGDLPRAVALGRRAIALHPRYALAQDHLALALRESGDAAAALPHHRLALELEGAGPDVYNHYGMTLRELGRLDEAVAAFEQALALAPGQVPPRLNLALTLSLQGRQEEAMRHYREARRLNPALPDLDRPGGR